MGRTGKESLMKMIEDYDVIVHADDKTTDHVRKVLQKYPLAEVRLSSNGVAAFYTWVCYYYF